MRLKELYNKDVTFPFEIFATMKPTNTTSQRDCVCEFSNIIDEHDKELKRIKLEKDKNLGMPLEKINKYYFKTETFNKLLHLNY